MQLVIFSPTRLALFLDGVPLVSWILLDPMAALPWQRGSRVRLKSC